MLRAIREIQPRWVVGENVRGLTNWNGGLVFDEVQADLENEGYEVTPYLLPACAVNAPHRRDRIWFVAHRHEGTTRPPGASGGIESNGRGNYAKQELRREQAKQYFGRGEFLRDTTNPNEKRLGRQAENGYMGWEQRFVQRGPGRQWENFPTQPPICGGNDGISRRLDGITFPKWREKSIGAYGNAIVPQVALQIFKAIQESEK